MLELNNETVRDIINALRLLDEFSKIDSSLEIPLASLNYKSVHKTNFRGDGMMVKSISSIIVSSLTEVIEEGVINDGELIELELEVNHREEEIEEMYEEEVKEMCMGIDNSGEDWQHYLHEYLGYKGMKYIILKIPFVTEINDVTWKLLRHIPFLVQYEYDLSEYYFISSNINMNTEFNCAQVEIYYFEDCYSCFVDDSQTDNMYNDIVEFIRDTERRRKLN